MALNIIFKNNTGLKIAPKAFQNNKNIEKLVVPVGTTSIGLGALEGCVNLKWLEIPFIGGSVYTEEGKAFFAYIFGCEKVPNGDDTTKGKEYFEALKTLKDNNKLPTGVQVIINSNIETVNKNAFLYCGNYFLGNTTQNINLIKAVVLPSSVLSVEDNAFKGIISSEFTSFTLPSNTQKIGHTSFLKYGANTAKLYWYTLKAWDDESLDINTETSLNSAFSSCVGYKYVGWDDSKKESTGVPFSITNPENEKEDTTNKVVKNGNTVVAKFTVAYNIFGGKLSEIEGRCGDNLTYELTEETEGTYKLNIKGYGAMWDFTQSTIPWQPSLISKIEMSEGITSIGSYAFYFARKLESLSFLPDTIVRIGKSSFEGANFQDTVFNKTFSALQTIEEYGFFNTNLTKINIENTQDDRVKIKDRAFYGNDKLTEVSLEFSAIDYGVSVFGQVPIETFNTKSYFPLANVFSSTTISVNTITCYGNVPTGSGKNMSVNTTPTGYFPNTLRNIRCKGLKQYTFGAYSSGAYSSNDYTTNFPVELFLTILYPELIEQGALIGLPKCNLTVSNANSTFQLKSAYQAAWSSGGYNIDHYNSSTPNFGTLTLENGNICESGCAGIKVDKVMFSNVSEIGEQGFANSSIGEIDLSSISKIKKQAFYNTSLQTNSSQRTLNFKNCIIEEEGFKKNYEDNDTTQYSLSFGGTVSIGDYGFYDFYVKNINLSSDAILTIGDYGLSCRGSNITIAYQEGAQIKTIGNYGFYNTFSSGSITIPNCQKIGKGAFSYYNHEVSGVTVFKIIGDNTTIIEEEAFSGHLNLHTLEIPTIKAPILYLFGGINIGVYDSEYTTNTIGGRYYYWIWKYKYGNWEGTWDYTSSLSVTITNQTNFTNTNYFSELDNMFYFATTIKLPHGATIGTNTFKNTSYTKVEGTTGGYDSYITQKNSPEQRSSATPFTTFAEEPRALVTPSEDFKNLLILNNKEYAWQALLYSDKYDVYITDNDTYEDGYSYLPKLYVPNNSNMRVGHRITLQGEDTYEIEKIDTFSYTNKIFYRQTKGVISGSLTYYATLTGRLTCHTNGEWTVDSELQPFLSEEPVRFSTGSSFDKDLVKGTICIVEGRVKVVLENGNTSQYNWDDTIALEKAKVKEASLPVEMIDIVKVGTKFTVAIDSSVQEVTAINDYYNITFTDGFEVSGSGYNSVQMTLADKNLVLSNNLNTNQVLIVVNTKGMITLNGNLGDEVKKGKIEDNLIHLIEEGVTSFVLEGETFVIQKVDKLTNTVYFSNSGRGFVLNQTMDLKYEIALLNYKDLSGADFDLTDLHLTLNYINIFEVTDISRYNNVTDSFGLNEGELLYLVTCDSVVNAKNFEVNERSLEKEMTLERYSSILTVKNIDGTPVQNLLVPANTGYYIYSNYIETQPYYFQTVEAGKVTLYVNDIEVGEEATITLDGGGADFKADFDGNISYYYWTLKEIYKDIEIEVDTNVNKYSSHIFYNYYKFKNGSSYTLKLTIVTKEGLTITKDYPIEVSYYESYPRYTGFNVYKDCLKQAIVIKNNQEIIQGTPNRTEEITAYYIIRQEKGKDETATVVTIVDSFDKVYDYSFNKEIEYEYFVLPKMKNEEGQYYYGPMITCVVEENGIITKNTSIQYQLRNITLIGTLFEFSDLLGEEKTPNSYEADLSSFNRWIFRFNTEDKSVSINTDKAVYDGTSQFATVNNTNRNYKTGSITAFLGSYYNENSEWVKADLQEWTYRDSVYLQNKFQEFANNGKIKMLRDEIGNVIPVDITLKSFEYNPLAMPSNISVSFEWTQVESEDKFVVYSKE